MSPSQLERERVAESTARYHQREYSRWLNVWADLNGGEPGEDELRRRFLFHWREIKAAEVRLVAIQLDGLTFDEPSGWSVVAALAGEGV